MTTDRCLSEFVAAVQVALAHVNPIPDTVDLKGAAAYLQLGVRATRKLFEDGELPGVSKNQKHHVFLRSDLRKYIHSEAKRQTEKRKVAKLQAQTRTRAHRRRPLPDLEHYERMAGIARK